MSFKTKKKKTTKIQLFLVTSIQIIHISNTNWAVFGMSGLV
jgi:hypothetical protein